MFKKNNQHLVNTFQKQSDQYVMDDSDLLSQYSIEVTHLKRTIDTFNEEVVSSSDKGKSVGLAQGSASEKLLSKREDLEGLSAQDKLFLANYLNNNNKNSFGSQHKDLESVERDLENKPVQKRVGKNKFLSYTDTEGQVYFIPKDLMY